MQGARRSTTAVRALRPLRSPCARVPSKRLANDRHMAWHRDMKRDPRKTGQQRRVGVQSFERGLALLRAFGADRAAMTTAEAAAAAGLTRAGARRLLMTLQEQGYAHFDGKRYALTPRVLELGFAWLSAQPLFGVGEPVAKRLAERLNETVSIGTLDIPDVVYLVRALSSRAAASAGGAGHAHSGAHLVDGHHPPGDARAIAARRLLQAVAAPSLYRSDAGRGERGPRPDPGGRARRLLLPARRHGRQHRRPQPCRCAIARRDGRSPRSTSAPACSARRRRRRSASCYPSCAPPPQSIEAALR